MDDEFLVDIFGSEPTREQFAEAMRTNSIRVERLNRVIEMLGPGLTDEGKGAWLEAPNPFLSGAKPAAILFDVSVDPQVVYDAIEQYNVGDFA